MLKYFKKAFSSDIIMFALILVYRHIHSYTCTVSNISLHLEWWWLLQMYFTKTDKQRETIGRVTKMDLPLWSNLMKTRGEDGSQKNTKGLWSSSEGVVFHFPKLRGSIISLTLQAPRLKLQNVVICLLQAPFNSVTQLLHTLLANVLSVGRGFFLV